MSDKEIVVKKEAALSTEVYAYGEYAGVGFEDVSASDLSIPFISLLQSNSKIVEEESLKGAKAGLLLNSVTKELNEELIFLPCLRQEAWVEWGPLLKGGGFKGIHEPTSELVTRLIRENGGSRIPPVGSDGKRISFKCGDNDIVETHYLYGLILNKEGTEQQGFAVIPFASTKVKVFRDLVTATYTLRGKPPLFANRMKLSTTKQTANNKTFYNFSISSLKDTWQDSLLNPSVEAEAKLLKEGLEFRKMVESGKAKADFNQQDIPDVTPSADAAPKEGTAPF